MKYAHVAVLASLSSSQSGSPQWQGAVPQPLPAGTGTPDRLGSGSSHARGRGAVLGVGSAHRLGASGHVRAWAWEAPTLRTSAVGLGHLVPSHVDCFPAWSLSGLASLAYGRGCQLGPIGLLVVSVRTLILPWGFGLRVRHGNMKVPVGRVPPSKALGPRSRLSSWPKDSPSASAISGRRRPPGPADSAAIERRARPSLARVLLTVLVGGHRQPRGRGPGCPPSPTDSSASPACRLAPMARRAGTDAGGTSDQALATLQARPVRALGEDGRQVLFWSQVSGQRRAPGVLPPS